jgi:hypothetical protein
LNAVGCCFFKVRKALERLLSEEPVVIIGKSAGKTRRQECLGVSSVGCARITHNEWGFM